MSMEIIDNYSHVVAGVDMQNDIAKKALSLGMCSTFLPRIETVSNVDELAELYKRGIDFIVLHGWPDSEYVREHISKDMLESHGIYLYAENEKAEKLGNGVYIVGGDVEMNVKLGSYSATTIHVIDNAKLKIEAGKKSFVFVRIYDKAHVDITATDGAHVGVIKYGFRSTASETHDETSEVQIRCKNFVPSGSRKTRY